MIVDIIELTALLILFVLVLSMGKEKQRKIELLADQASVQELTEKELTAKVRLLTSENARLLTQLETAEAAREDWQTQAVENKRLLISNGWIKG